MPSQLANQRESPPASPRPRIWLLVSTRVSLCVLGFSQGPGPFPSCNGNSALLQSDSSLEPAVAMLAADRCISEKLDVDSLSERCLSLLSSSSGMRKENAAFWDAAEFPACFARRLVLLFLSSLLSRSPPPLLDSSDRGESLRWASLLGKLLLLLPCSLRSSCFICLTVWLLLFLSSLCSSSCHLLSSTRASSSTMSRSRAGGPNPNPPVLLLVSLSLLLLSPSPAPLPRLISWLREAVVMVIVSTSSSSVCEEEEGERAPSSGPYGQTETEYNYLNICK